MRIRKITGNRSCKDRRNGLNETVILLLICSWFLQGCIASRIQQGNSFVPDDFQVPLSKVTDILEFRVLTIADAEADYEAVMETKERLRLVFGETWPPDNFTLEENKADLIEHEHTFKQRTAFTYTLASLSSDDLLGCIYIVPGTDTDAQIIYWVRETAYKQGMEPIMLMHLKNWMDSAWPFKTVEYIGKLP